MYLMSAYKKKFYSSLITLGSILFTLGLLFILRLSKDFSEFWSRTISRVEQYIAHTIFGWLPFSAFELFIWFIIILIITFLVLLIRHLVRFGLRGSSKYYLNFSIIISLILLVYMGTAGMEYNRYPVDIPQHTELIDDVNIYKEMAMHYQKDYNEISKTLEYDNNGMLIRPYSNKKMNEIMKEEFHKLDDSKYFTKITPSGKHMVMWGWLYRELQITGIAFAPLGEPNINQLCTPGEYPFTLAHEIAHTKGIIREEDANLVAAYICLNSSDPYLRYSGYVWTISSLASLVRCTNVEQDYKDFQYGFSKECVLDSHARYDYWQKHDLLGKFSDWLNNLYLYIQGDKGTESYSDNIDIHEDTSTHEYKVSSYSRYQALYLWMYLDK